MAKELKEVAAAVEIVPVIISRGREGTKAVQKLPGLRVGKDVYVLEKARAQQLLLELAKVIKRTM